MENVVIADWQILTYKDDKFTPNSIRRADGSVFFLGDTVSNGSKMRGKIESFDLVENYLYVTTDWSKIGMHIDSIYHVQLLPSNCQLRQVVYFEVPASFPDIEKKADGTKITATVIGIHFYESKVKYDLELWLIDNHFTRIYNIDSAYVTEI